MSEDFWSPLRERLEQMNANESFGKAQMFDRDSASEMRIEKRGVVMPFSWEQLIANPRKGHYVSTGIKWVQHLGYLLDKMKFSLYRWLEKSLDKSRHFSGPGGYDWEEATFHEFKQKERWVEDESLE